MKTLIASFLLILISAGAAFSEVPIEVISSTDDEVGGRLLYFVKEKIRLSDVPPKN